MDTQTKHLNQVAENVAQFLVLVLESCEKGWIALRSSFLAHMSNAMVFGHHVPANLLIQANVMHKMSMHLPTGIEWHASVMAGYDIVVPHKMCSRAHQILPSHIQPITTTAHKFFQKMHHSTRLASFGV